MHLALVASNCRYTHSSLSLFYVRNELESHLPDATVSLHQLTINDPYFDTLLTLTELKADGYFFSVYVWNVERILRIVQDIATILPQSLFVFGGPQAGELPLNELPAKSTIVSGEIEGAPPAFYEDLLQGTLSRRYRCESHSAFPSPYREEDFKEELANRSVYYESSRGCPYSCSYCLSAAERGIRQKKLSQVSDELSLICRHEPVSVRFVDRTFNASSERALAIWRFLRALNISTCFHFEISPDLFTEEMFLFLEDVPVGLFQFEVGIQSTNPATLAAINRKTDCGRALTNIRRLLALNTVHLHVDLICGLPHENVATFKKSFDDVFALLPHHIQMGHLKVLPNTPLAGQTGQYCLISCRRPPYEILATGWLDHGELIRLHLFGQCVEAFYNNRFFKAFFRYVSRSNESGFVFFEELLGLCEETGFLRRTKTQKLMSELLLSLAPRNGDAGLVKEILRFDWLRSGHRFLPDHLDPELLREEKNRLWKVLPQEKHPLYDHSTRDRFFKQSLFLGFSGQTLRELGFAHEDRGVLCFLPEREDGVLALTRVVLIREQ